VVGDECVADRIGVPIMARAVAGKNMRGGGRRQAIGVAVGKPMGRVIAWLTVWTRAELSATEGVCVVELGCLPSHSDDSRALALSRSWRPTPFSCVPIKFDTSAFSLDGPCRTDDENNSEGL